MIQNNDSREYDARKSDVWSCGVVLYIMISCQYPFTQDKEDDPNSIKAMHKLVQVLYLWIFIAYYAEEFNQMDHQS